MKVQDAMARTVTGAGPASTVLEVAQIMKREDCGFVPVVERDNSLVGVVTDRDIVLRCLAERHHDCLDEPIERIMSTDLHVISPDDDLEMAAERMSREGVRRLAVVEERHLVGVLSHGNLVQAMRGEGPAMAATVGLTRGA